MALSTGGKVAFTLGVALSALAALGAIAAWRIWQDEQPLLGTVVLVLVGVVAAVLIAEARNVRLDLAENARAHEALLASEARVAGLVSIAADAIVSVDEAHRITLFNRGAEEIFGYSAREVLGRPLAELLPGRFRATHDQHLDVFAAAPEMARRMGERAAIAGLRKDGTEFPAEASILKQRVDGRPSFTVVLRDATERKRIEESQRFLADAGGVLTRTLDAEEAVTAVAQLPVPRVGDVCFVDLIENERVRRVTSVSGDPALDARVAALADAPGIDSASAIVDVLRTRRPLLVAEVTDEWLQAHTETADLLERTRSLGGRSAIFVPLVARGEVLGVLTVISTRPERRYGPGDVALMERLADRAAFAIDNARLFGLSRAASRARDDMLGVVSHDLRNPVNAIGMCVRVLRESPPDDPQARAELVNAIADAVEWMDRLIRDLLDVASIETGRLSIVRHREEVRPIVDSAVAMFAHGAQARGVRLTQEVPAGLPPVDGDAARLVQVLSNLLANALAHTEAGGNVSIAVAAADGEVLFTVRDTGSGIPVEELPHIFERHWRGHTSARKGGSGLGLAISHGLVQAHGGRIWAESVPGQGSAFHLTIPSGPAHA